MVLDSRGSPAWLHWRVNISLTPQSWNLTNDLDRAGSYALITSTLVNWPGVSVFPYHCNSLFTIIKIGLLLCSSLKTTKSYQGAGKNGMVRIWLPFKSAKHNVDLTSYLTANTGQCSCLSKHTELSWQVDTHFGISALPRSGNANINAFMRALWLILPVEFSCIPTQRRSPDNLCELRVYIPSISAMPFSQLLL